MSGTGAGRIKYIATTIRPRFQIFYETKLLKSWESISGKYTLQYDFFQSIYTFAFIDFEEFLVKRLSNFDRLPPEI